MDSPRRQLLSTLSDSLQTFYLRALLEDSRTEILGSAERAVILNKSIGLGVLHGHPPMEDVNEAVSEGVEILTAVPLSGLTPGWEWRRGVFMALEDRAALQAWQERAEGIVVSLDELALARAPSHLRPLLEEALHRGHATCALVEGKPVAFASTFLRTDIHFDISVDTLEPYRNQGFARMAAAMLAGSEQLKGLCPHWGALETNLASLCVGRSLGFRPAGNLWLACQTNR